MIVVMMGIKIQISTSVSRFPIHIDREFSFRCPERLTCRGMTVVFMFDGERDMRVDGVQ